MTEEQKSSGYTVRELLVELTKNAQDLDSEITISIFNSDGVPIKGIEFDSENEQMQLVADTRV